VEWFILKSGASGFPSMVLGVGVGCHRAHGVRFNKVGTHSTSYIYIYTYTFHTSVV